MSVALDTKELQKLKEIWKPLVDTRAVEDVDKNCWSKEGSEQYVEILLKQLGELKDSQIDTHLIDAAKLKLIMFVDELQLKATDLDDLESRLGQAFSSSEKICEMKKNDYSSHLLKYTAKLVAPSDENARKECETTMKSWKSTMKSWISPSVKESPPFTDRAVDVLYDSKMYLFARVVCALNHATPEQVEDWKEKATSSTAKLLAEIANTQAYEKTTTVVFDGYLEMAALVLMSCAVEVQIDAWVLRCSASSKPTIFLETLFRYYANTLTWLRVQYGVLTLSNAYWCLKNKTENTTRYDILVCSHVRLVKLLETAGDTTSAASLESCMDNRDVFEYLTHLDSLRFDVELPRKHHAHKANVIDLLTDLTSLRDKHAKTLRDAFKDTLKAAISTDEESLSDVKQLRKVLKKVPPDTAISADKKSRSDADTLIDEFETQLKASIATRTKFFTDPKELCETCEKVALNRAIEAGKKFLGDTKELCETCEKVALHTAIAACKIFLGDTKELCEAFAEDTPNTDIATDEKSLTDPKKLREAFEEVARNTAIAACKKFLGDTKKLREDFDKFAPSTAMATNKNFARDTMKLLEAFEKATLNTAIAACKNCLGDTKKLLETFEKFAPSTAMATDEKSLTDPKKHREPSEKGAKQTAISTCKQILGNTKELLETFEKFAPSTAMATDEKSLTDPKKHREPSEKGAKQTAISTCKQILGNTKELLETFEKFAPSTAMATNEKSLTDPKKLREKFLLSTLNTAITTCKQLLADTNEILDASEKVKLDKTSEKNTQRDWTQTKLRDIFNKFVVSTAIESRKQSSLVAKNHTVYLHRVKQRGVEPREYLHVHTWTPEQFYSDDHVFGLDMKTRLTEGDERIEEFLSEMTTAQLFDNVTLLFYLRSRDDSKLSSLFKGTGLWFYETSAWNVGDMLAKKYARTENAGNTDTSTAAFLADKAKEERCFIAFDNDIFRRFTNVVYKLDTQKKGGSAADLKIFLLSTLNAPVNQSTEH